MIDRTGIPVKVVEYVPPDSMVAFGAHGESPDDWESMSEEERFQWCVLHGATILMHPDMYNRLKQAAVESELFK